jgi:hypothetical protein
MVYLDLSELRISTSTKRRRSEVLPAGSQGPMGHLNGCCHLTLGWDCQMER